MSGFEWQTRSGPAGGAVGNIDFLVLLVAERRGNDPAGVQSNVPILVADKSGIPAEVVIAPASRWRSLGCRRSRRAGHLK